jgi:hypothetical protein
MIPFILIVLTYIVLTNVSLRCAKEVNKIDRRGMFKASTDDLYAMAIMMSYVPVIQMVNIIEFTQYKIQEKIKKDREEEQR